MIVPGSVNPLFGCGLMGGVAKDPYWENVVLLMRMNGTHGSTTFTDEVGHTITTFGGAQISTDQYKWNSSGYFNGSESPKSYLSVLKSGNDFQFGTGDFTIECWVYRLDSVTDDAIICLEGVGYHAGTWELNIQANRLIGWYFNVYSSFHITNSAIANNTWHHIAAVRSGTTLYIFIDGIGQSFTDSTNYNYDANLTIGMSLYNSDNELYGYIDELRVTKGVARYVSNFTPPIAPFPNY